LGSSVWQLVYYLLIDMSQKVYAPCVGGLGTAFVIKLCNAQIIAKLLKMVWVSFSFAVFDWPIRS